MYSERKESLLDNYIIYDIFKRLWMLEYKTWGDKDGIVTSNTENSVTVHDQKQWGF